jgi:hypothetical protein
MFVACNLISPLGGRGRVLELVYRLVLETSAERIVGSTPTLTTKAGLMFNGSMSVFQIESTGSNPVSRSNTLRHYLPW